MQMFMKMFRSVARESGANIPDLKVLLPLPKLGYMLSGFILTVRVAKFGKRFIRELVGYKTRIKQYLSTDNLWRLVMKATVLC